VCTCALCHTLTEFYAVRYEGRNFTCDNAENGLLTPFLLLLSISFSSSCSCDNYGAPLGRCSIKAVFCVCSTGRGASVCWESACRQKHGSLTEQVTRNSLSEKGVVPMGWEDLNLCSALKHGAVTSPSQPWYVQKGVRAWLCTLLVCIAVGKKNSCTVLWLLPQLSCISCVGDLLHTWLLPHFILWFVLAGTYLLSL